MSRILNVLLLDDNEDVFEAISFYLEKHGHKVDTFTSPEEALKSSTMYDILISDFDMPGMNGCEFFKKARTTWPNAYRVLISGYRRMVEVNNSGKDSYHVFFNKLDDLESTIESILMEHNFFRSAV